MEELRALNRCKMRWNLVELRGLHAASYVSIRVVLSQALCSPESTTHPACTTVQKLVKVVNSFIATGLLQCYVRGYLKE